MNMISHLDGEDARTALATLMDTAGTPQERARRLAADASARVPIDTGALRDSIGVRITKTSAEVGFDPKRFRRKWKKAGWRAVFVEKGTKGAPGRNIPPMAARPFLRPAFEANRQQILERHRAAVVRLLHQAASL